MRAGGAGGLIDTHCHLNLEPLCSRLQQVLDEARHAGVDRFVVPGIQPGGWQGILALADSSACMLPAFGIHPAYAAEADKETLLRLDALAPRGIAIGEIGLDAACAAPRPVQTDCFRAQIRIAVTHGLPILVHCRGAFRETLNILDEERADRVGGIMHAYSGSPEMAREFIRRGFVISLSGTLTWEHAVRPLRLARELPLDHLVLETDAPDLSPGCHRGQPNRPAWLPEILHALAEIRGLPMAELARRTRATSETALRLPTTVP
jgi:TatD DNase family protein